MFSLSWVFPEQTCLEQPNFPVSYCQWKPIPPAWIVSSTPVGSNADESHDMMTAFHLSLSDLPSVSFDLVLKTFLNFPAYKPGVFHPLEGRMTLDVAAKPQCACECVRATVFNNNKKQTKTNKKNARTSQMKDLRTAHCCDCVCMCMW